MMQDPSAKEQELENAEGENRRERVDRGVRASNLGLLGEPRISSAQGEVFNEPLCLYSLCLLQIISTWSV